MSDELYWRTMDMLPEYDQRPSRMFIHVEGFTEHSGVHWNRQAWGLASIRRNDDPECMLGFRRDDILHICRENDIQCIERILHWMPAQLPSFAPTDVAKALWGHGLHYVAPTEAATGEA